MLLALAAIWGSSYLFIKIGVEDGLSPSFISFARLALGALVLVPIAARSGALRGLRGNGRTVAFLGVVQTRGTVPPDRGRRAVDLVLAGRHPRGVGADLHCAARVVARP